MLKWQFLTTQQPASKELLLYKHLEERTQFCHAWLKDINPPSVYYLCHSAIPSLSWCSLQPNILDAAKSLSCCKKKNNEKKM